MARLAGIIAGVAAGVGAGAVVGAVGVRRARALVRPDGRQGARHLAGSWWAAVREFAADVGEGMTEREAELRAALGVDAEGAHLDPPQARELLERPTRPRH